MPVVDRVAAPALRNRGIRGYGSRLKAGTTEMVRFDFQIANSKTRDHIPAARCARVLTKPFAPKRAWGMPGARCTRSRAWCVESTRVSHHGRTGITRHS